MHIRGTQKNSFSTIEPIVESTFLNDVDAIYLIK